LAVHGQCSVELALAEHTFVVPVVVAEVGDVQGVIGMEFLKLNNCSMALGTGLLKCGDVVWKLVPPSCEEVRQVRLLQEVRVAAGHEIVVRGKVDEFGKEEKAWYGVAEPDTQLLMEANVLMPRALVKVHDRQVEMTVANHTGDEVLLLPGTTVAALSTAESMHEFMSTVASSDEQEPGCAQVHMMSEQGSN
jgi:hypothetical protein